MEDVTQKHNILFLQHTRSMLELKTPFIFNYEAISFISESRLERYSLQLPMALHQGMKDDESHWIQSASYLWIKCSFWISYWCMDMNFNLLVSSSQWFINSLLIKTLGHSEISLRPRQKQVCFRKSALACQCISSMNFFQPNDQYMLNFYRIDIEVSLEHKFSK